MINWYDEVSLENTLILFLRDPYALIIQNNNFDIVNMKHI